jgi:hypothetical protein
MRECCKTCDAAFFCAAGLLTGTHVHSEWDDDSPLARAPGLKGDRQFVANPLFGLGPLYIPIECPRPRVFDIEDALPSEEVIFT